MSAIRAMAPGGAPAYRRGPAAPLHQALRFLEPEYLVMSTNTIIIIILLVLLFGGGWGYSRRGR